MTSRTKTVAGLLLKEAREDRGLSWRTAWALEDFFGHSDESEWTLRTALDHCMKADRPCPTVAYDFHDHTLKVQNGCLLVRIVKLQAIPENA